MIQGRWLAVTLLTITMPTFSKEASRRAVEAVPSEFVVKLKRRSGILSHQTLRRLERRWGVRVVERISSQSDTLLVRRPAGEVAAFSLAQLNSQPEIAYAEPNYIYRWVGASSSMQAPNDPEFSSLWGLSNHGQKSQGDSGEIDGIQGIDLDALRAWAIETGREEVVIASIDSGIDYRQPDLKENMWVNRAEAIGLSGVDDDQNGFIDDVHGYDFPNNDGDPMDDQGHGTHTSGTIVARGDNGVGIVGVAWRARIMGVKFLDVNGGGTLVDAIKSIDYTTQMGVDITSNSWAGGSYSQALYESIQRARDAGILFVAAAGNNGDDNDQRPDYPSSYDLDNIVSVAAINARGDLASFSCYGRTTVDVAAPGVNILSLTPSGLMSWSGTSMAAPHVAGVAALLKSREPNLSPSEIRERLLNTAFPLPALRGRVASGGMVNAYHALTNTVPPPNPQDPFNWPMQNQAISTPHPYPDGYKKTWRVRVLGASRIAIYFTRFETELGYDKVTIKDAEGKTVAVWSGNRSNTFSPVVSGDSAEITMESDDSAALYGFDIGGIAYQ